MKKWNEPGHGRRLCPGCSKPGKPQFVSNGVKVCECGHDFKRSSSQDAQRSREPRATPATATVADPARKVKTFPDKKAIRFDDLQDLLNMSKRFGGLDELIETAERLRSMM